MPMSESEISDPSVTFESLEPAITSSTKPSLDKVSWFSRVTLEWITPFLWKAYRQGLAATELPNISFYDGCCFNVQRMESLWKEELETKGPNNTFFCVVMWKFVRYRIIVSCLLLTCGLICGILSPAVCMKNILEHITSSNSNVWRGTIWAIAQTVCEIGRLMFITSSWIMNYQTAMRLKSAYATIVYKKILMLGNITDPEEIKNMFEKAGHTMSNMICLGTMTIHGPIAFLGVLSYVLWYFPTTALLGVFFYLMSIPSLYAGSLTIGHYSEKVKKITNYRLQLIYETLVSLKLIKAYAWEKYFIKNLSDVREEENKWFRSSEYVRSLSISCIPTIPIISLLVMHFSCFYIADPLNVVQIFTLIALLNEQIRSLFVYTQLGLDDIGDLKILSKKLKDILLTQENNYPQNELDTKSGVIDIVNATFVVDDVVRKNFSTENTNQQEDNQNGIELSTFKCTMADEHEILTDITFKCRIGKLTGICGHVNSGKSSLLLAALGQLRVSKGSISRYGSCAYVPQSSWMIDGSVKDNILFGDEFNDALYERAINLCNLEMDLNILAYGDRTEIGDGSTTLSDCQMQRISLARAFYANKDVYFLDDPLNAIEAKMGFRIFEDLIIGALKDKTVLLVTNDTQILEKCNYICVMENGKLAEQGTPKELLSLNKIYALLLASDQANTSQTNRHLEVYQEPECHLNQGDEEDLYYFDSKENNNVLETAGILEKTANAEMIITWTYKTYLQTGGSFVALMVFVGAFLHMNINAFVSWVIAHWMDHTTETTIMYSSGYTDLSLDLYKILLCSCIGFILLACFFFGLALTFFTNKASTWFHNAIIEKIIRVPMKFFRTTPINRIQNLFCRDIDELENNLPSSMNHVMSGLMTCCFSISIVCIVLPYVAIPCVLVGLISAFIVRMFRAGIRDFQGMANAAQSPFYSFIASSVQGSSTIRAFGKEAFFIEKFQQSCDAHNSYLFFNQVSQRWMALRLDILTILIITGTAVNVVFLGGATPSFAALALAYAAQIPGALQYTLRMFLDLETRFISMESIHHYLNISKTEDEEKQSTIELPEGWPTEGRLRFKDVRMRYGNDVPCVLSALSFTVAPESKLGVVGKPGCGKSSIVSAILRLQEICNGRIEIDRVDISKINLETLRTRISIIPQDPTLFTGTIRFNIDPSKKFEDSVIWKCLEKTQLRTKIKNMEGELNARVSFGGNNFSVGERQRLCLTRALLEKNKILIVDGVISPSEPQTEKIVVDTIDRDFNNCTVLTLTDKILPLAQCHRIMVMSEGRILNEYRPTNLVLADRMSRFSRLVEDTLYTT